jgi:peptidoglycan/LPS O-acetylase OafA/YrhL
VEVQFYILAPLLAYLFSIKKVKLRRLTLVGIILSSLGFNQFHFNPFHFISLINCLHYFILGFLLVDLYVSKTYFIRKTKFDKLFGLVFFLLIWLFDAKDFDGYAVRYGWRIVQLASIFFFYYYVVFNKTYRFFSFKWITGIGGMCYSIYLLHSPIIGLIGNPLMKFQFSDLSFINIPIFTAILIGAVLSISAAFYLLIERPCMDQNWPRKLLKMGLKPFTKRN